MGGAVGGGAERSERVGPAVADFAELRLHCLCNEASQSSQGKEIGYVGRRVGKRKQLRGGGEGGGGIAVTTTKGIASKMQEA